MYQVKIVYCVDYGVYNSYIYATFETLEEAEECLQMIACEANAYIEKK